MGMFLQDAGHVLPAILVGSLKVAPFTSTQTSMGKTMATTERYALHWNRQNLADCCAAHLGRQSSSSKAHGQDLIGCLSRRSLFQHSFR